MGPMAPPPIKAALSLYSTNVSIKTDITHDEDALRDVFNKKLGKIFDHSVPSLMEEFLGDTAQAFSYSTSNKGLETIKKFIKQLGQEAFWRDFVGQPVDRWTD